MIRLLIILSFILHFTSVNADLNLLVTEVPDFEIVELLSLDSCDDGDGSCKENDLILADLIALTIVVDKKIENINLVTVLYSDREASFLSYSHKKSHRPTAPPFLS